MKGSAPPALILITGPTGSGKTDLVHVLAEKMPAPIISADSMQVYRHMDIGTAKPNREERSKYAYRLIDLVNPDEPFNAAIFQDYAAAALEETGKKGHLAYVAGGTGLYIKVLLGGLIAGPGPDEALRSQHREWAEKYGRSCLHALLRKRDPAAADRLNPNDLVRVSRALEVLELTGQSITGIQKGHAFQRTDSFRYVKIGVMMERQRLQQRIEARVERMWEAGLEDEVKQLLRNNYGPELKSMQSLGYRHVVGYLQGCWSKDQAMTLMKRDTWQYAKRQMTWFKKDAEIIWFEPDDIKGIRSRIDCFREGLMRAGENP